MKLDRNCNPSGTGKYALIKLRESGPLIEGDSSYITVPSETIDFGANPDSEFFVIRLRDKYASMALIAYAQAAMKDDPEYAREVMELAFKAETHPAKKKPD